MAELHPHPFAALLGRALEELPAREAIFDLPRRSFWRGDAARDLSVLFHGERAATPAGPAAGPHTQLAQNIVLAWLAGARIIELKTMQVKDDLVIPRPCIDAATIGFNVEWSQELRLAQSIEQYVAAWYLIHVLRARGVTGSAPDRDDTLFDISIGYDLAGIRSDAIARSIDTLQGAGALLAEMRESVPPALRAAADILVPPRLASCVTLSTFHGCPADEIEGIVEHLFDRHGVHVVVKLNPTLLGYGAVEEILRGRLGYDEIRLDRHAFESDLQWDKAVEMFGRLARSAKRGGLTLGAKFTNTLVVANHKSVFQDPVMYMSGQPLHVLAMTLAHRFTEAMDGQIPLSFSAGIDATNFPEAVACGMTPVTGCTDLLRAGGYARLGWNLRALETQMTQLGAATVPENVMARATNGATAADGADPVRAAARRNLATYVASLPDNPRYHAVKNRTAPRRLSSRLALFDCVSCNKCVAACPNDANFALATGSVSLDTWDLVVRDGAIERRAAHFALVKPQQWATYADFCNECGNCDVFCPEEGAPYKLKPRFVGSYASFDALAPADGIFVADGGARVLARLDGVVHSLTRVNGVQRFTDGVLEADLDAAHAVVATRAADGAAPREGHTLPLGRYHALRILRDAVLAGTNPVSAAARAAGSA